MSEGWEYYLQQAGVRWREAFIPLLAGSVIDASREYHLEYGMTFNAVDVLAADWFNQYTLKFAQDINTTTKSDISAVLQQAMMEGWSVPTMQNNLETLFDQYMNGNLSPSDFEWFKERMPAYRTEMIARTETLGASNTSAWRTMKSWGAEYKSWLATMDSRTRFSHQIAYSDYGKGGRIGPIPVDEPFMVNGQRMMYPGDKLGGAGEIVNCRCTLLSWFGDELGDSPAKGASWKSYDDYDERRDYEKSWSNFLSQLTDEERAAIEAYTGSAHGGMNRWLRRGEMNWSDEHQAYLEGLIAKMDSAFQNNMARLREDTQLYRTLPLDALGLTWDDLNDPARRANLIGVQMRDNGFMSTTINHTNTEHSSFSLVIRAPTGTPGIYVREISRYPHEEELLLGRGSKYQIVDIQVDERRLRSTITVEIINE